MEEERHWFSQEEDEVQKIIQRFERMKRNNENYFFDVIEFETIIDYYLERNNQARAFEAASIASKQHPNSVPILLRNAKVLLDRGRIAESLLILKKLETIEPGNHEIFLVKGTALGMMGDIQGARKMFDLALAKDSDDVENILFSITSILQNLNYYKEVIPYLERLIELEPYYPEHLYDMAYAYEKIDDFENSIKYYTRFLDEEPFSDSAWYNLGMIYNKTERHYEALEAYDYALAINPQNDFALFNKGVVLAYLGKYEEAIHAYQEYLQIEPESHEAMTYIAECYEKTGNPSLAKKYYYEAIELAPDFTDAWIGLGISELNSGNAEKSLGFFRKAAEIDSSNPELWYFTGKAFMLTGNKKRALRCFRESLKIDPYYHDSWYEFGKIIIEEKLATRTLPLLNKAYKIIGDIPGINYLMAALYVQSGNNKSAIVHLKKALELDNKIFEKFIDLFPKEINNKDIRSLLKGLTRNT
ncbi:MAG TPA: tetratricopeptide repeat protein [Bacteroidales bacterium]|nr:tetratricopeptide repeat protein [Bacteroidales bacterium]